MAGDVRERREITDDGAPVVKTVDEGEAMQRMMRKMPMGRMMPMGMAFMSIVPALLGFIAGFLVGSTRWR